MNLFPFQREAVERLKSEPNVLIADEMGTGKTYMGVALDLERPRKGDTLVVCPLSVGSAWRDLFESEGKTVAVLDPKNRKGFLENDAEVFIVHWQAVRLMPELRGYQWGHIIADEVHWIQNRKAQVTVNFKKIPAHYKTALSGTPVTNTPDKFWSVLNWLYPKEWTSYWRFFHRFCETERVQPMGYWKVLGPKNTAELHLRIRPYYIRRLKEQVLKDLPPKYYTQIPIKLLPEQRKMYDDMKRDMLAWLDDGSVVVAPVVIAQLTRLQQFCDATAIIDNGSLMLSEPSAKIDALVEIINYNPDKQFVVFSQFAQMARLLVDRLDRETITNVSLTGETPQSSREQVIRTFQSRQAQVFVGTIQAGGVGITLTAADTVVFLDRTWSPATNSQAEDRLHRIGQQSAVHVIDLVAQGTVERGRHQRLETKKEGLKKLLDTDED